MHIAISGLIGAGKTTLAEKLSAIMGLPLYKEPIIDNAYLQDFYSDMGKYGFRLQVYLLTRRFEQQQQLLWMDKGGIQDRSIYEDLVFARVLTQDGLMTDRDLATYQSLFKCVEHSMERPSVIVHLHVTPEIALERIRMRGRECETGITLEYLQKLHDEYEKFIQEISTKVRVVVVNWTEFGCEDKLARDIADTVKNMTMIVKL